MHYNKQDLLSLPIEERKELASELIDSILTDEAGPVPEWKKQLIQERINNDSRNASASVEWSELRKKYLGK